MTVKTKRGANRNIGCRRQDGRRLGVFFLSAFMNLLLIGCTGAGIYSTIAISSKIDEGKLPKGLSAGTVFSVSGAAEHLFFVSGPNIWAKPKSGGEWNPIGLSAGGAEWDGVQSAAATDSRIILALYSVSGNTYRVGLFALTRFNGSTPTYADFNKSWTSTSKSFQTIRLFCPQPGESIYVNVLDHQGSYGSIDSENNGFKGSKLYKLANDSNSWNPSNPGEQQKLQTRYVTGVADNNSGTILVTASSGKSDGGYLLIEDGAAKGDGKIDGSYTPTTGITWIDRKWEGHSGPGAFIAAGIGLVGGVYPIFVSEDGLTWHRLEGASGSYRTTSFIDVSDKAAGMSDSKHLVLAGTSSYIGGNRYRSGAGYYEIDVTADDLTKWVVNTSRTSYSLADRINYNVSKLSESTVTAMTAHDNALYASTRNNGIWKLNLGEDRPLWARE